MLWSGTEAAEQLHSLWMKLNYKMHSRRAKMHPQPLRGIHGTSVQQVQPEASRDVHSQTRGPQHWLFHSIYHLILPWHTYWSQNSFWQLKWGWEELHLQKRQPVAALPLAILRLLHEDLVFFPNHSICLNFLVLLYSVELTVFTLTSVTASLEGEKCIINTNKFPADRTDQAAPT